MLLSCLGKLHDHTTDYFERRLKNVPIDLATLCAELIVCNGMCKPKKNERKMGFNRFMECLLFWNFKIPGEVGRIPGILSSSKD